MLLYVEYTAEKIILKKDPSKNATYIESYADGHTEKYPSNIDITELLLYVVIAFACILRMSHTMLLRKLSCSRMAD